jgi:hypothetical protein
MALTSPASHVDAIIALAEEIAQVAPECADNALRIIESVRKPGDRPDRAMIEEAIEGQLIDSELSEPQLQTVTSTVFGSIRTTK